ncbi:hypothetical protein BJ170DRAFT_403594 [Xylariales sp. AK1849]|nr:hypothetical protein BJ170DRAFT_403594 [Xylariales sp. AK1849]
MPDLGTETKSSASSDMHEALDNVLAEHDCPPLESPPDDCLGRYDYHDNRRIYVSRAAPKEEQITVGRMTIYFPQGMKPLIWSNGVRFPGDTLMTSRPVKGLRLRYPPTMGYRQAGLNITMFHKRSKLANRPGIATQGSANCNTPEEVRNQQHQRLPSTTTPISPSQAIHTLATVANNSTAAELHGQPKEATESDSVSHTKGRLNDTSERALSQSEHVSRTINPAEALSGSLVCPITAPDETDLSAGRIPLHPATSELIESMITHYCQRRHLSNTMEGNCAKFR